MSDPEVTEQVHELQLLRHEYQMEMSISCDQDKKWRLYRMIQELSSCIDHLQETVAH
jgi:hypothetical protein